MHGGRHQVSARDPAGTLAFLPAGVTVCESAGWIDFTVR